MKKTISILVALAMCVGMLAACGRNDSNNSAAAKPTAAPNEVTDKEKNVTITVGMTQTDMLSSGVLEDLADKFTEETGIKVDYQVSPDAQWRDILRAKISTGEAPDIMVMECDPLSLYERMQPDENCVDLTDEAFIDRIDPSALTAVTWNDRVWGVPFNGVKMWVYIYNKEIFEQLNLHVPTNYEEFKEVCQTIKDSGVTPIYEACSDGWHQSLPLIEVGFKYAKNDPTIFEKLNKNEVDFTEFEDYKKVLYELKEFGDLGFYGSDFLSNSVAGDKEAFANGQVAMTLNAPGWANELIAAYPEMEGKCGFFIMPWIDNQGLGLNPGGAIYFANAKSERKEEAVEFLRFLTRTENLQERFDRDLTQSALCWPEIESRYAPEFQDYIDKMDSGAVLQVSVTYMDSQAFEIGKELDAMWAGVMTPEEIMVNISQRRADLAALQNDPAWK